MPPSQSGDIKIMYKSKSINSNTETGKQSNKE